MPLVVSEGSYEEIYYYVSVIFAAYTNPLHPFVAALLPGLGANSFKAVQDGIRDEAERAFLRWKSSPFEKWVKVMDTVTGEVIAVSRWQIFTENPFSNGIPPTEAIWLPEGSRLREYCTFIMNDRMQRQFTRCPIPHIWLSMICTQPNHRRRGAARLMLDWGADQADRLGCEIFVEAADSSDGEIYRKAGYVEGDHYWTRRLEPKPDEEWTKLEEKHPFTATWMWRPKLGIIPQITEVEVDHSRNIGVNSI